MSKIKTLTEDDLAEIIAAEEALDVLWKRVRSMAFKPYITQECFDDVTNLLRDVEAGVRVAHRYLIEIRRDL